MVSIDGRDLRRGLGHDVALVAAGAAWVGLLLWQILLAIWAFNARAEVQHCEAWLFDADVFQQSIQRSSVQLAGALAKGRPVAPPRSTSPDKLLRKLPVSGEKAGIARRRWSQAMADLDASIDALGHDRSDPKRIAACLERLEVGGVATADLERLVRVDLATHTVDLDTHWASLQRLSAGMFTSIAVLMWLLVRSKRRAKDFAVAKQALQMSESRLRELLQMQLGFAWSIDLAGRWAYLSEGAREVYGRDPLDMIGRRVVDFVPPGRVEVEHRFLNSVIAAESTVLDEAVHLDADGERVTLLIEAKAMRDESSHIRGITGFAMDVTALHAMRERQLHTDRLETIQTLADGVAHDFSNLLGVIHSTIGLARDVLPEEPTLAAESLHDADEAAARADALTKQLQDFARRQETSEATADLTTVVRENEAFMARLLGAAIALECSLPGESLHVRAHRGQVEQILLNLLMNSRESMPYGGKIEVEALRRQVDAPEAELAGIEPGEWAILTVSDNGIGMDGDTRRRAFEPFFTTRRPHGSGLGLAAVHGLTRAQGGGIHLVSAPGVGTSFEIYLPLTATRELVPA